MKSNMTCIQSYGCKEIDCILNKYSDGLYDDLSALNFKIIDIRLIWLRITEEGPIPVMRIWSILLIRFWNGVLMLAEDSFLYHKVRFDIHLDEQDKSSDIEQQPPFGERKLCNSLHDMRIGTLNVCIIVCNNVYDLVLFSFCSFYSTVFVLGSKPKRGTQSFWEYCLRNPPLPKYWISIGRETTLSSLMQSTRYPKLECVEVDKRTGDSIRRLVQNTTSNIGLGRDGRNLHHSNLIIRRIERIENLDLFVKYLYKRQEFIKKLASPQHTFTPLHQTRETNVRILTSSRIDRWMTSDIYEEINECYLFHGTKREFVENIKTKGLKPGERGMFGSGIYTAENSTKSDQYAGNPKDFSS